MPWHVYIIKCKDGKLYTGITNNLSRRINEHNSGNGCRFTKSRFPVRLLHAWRVSGRPGALKCEARIKRLTRKGKLELVKASLTSALTGFPPKRRPFNRSSLLEKRLSKG